MQFIFSEEEKKALVKELAAELAPVLIEELNLRTQFPPVLSRKEFMEFVGIGETKCAELFNRRDFPVNREFGHPKVPTQLLMEWIHANTDWVRENAPKLMHLNKVI